MNKSILLIIAIALCGCATTPSTSSGSHTEIKRLEKMLAAHPVDPELHYNLAANHYHAAEATGSRHHRDKAIEHFRQVLVYAPDNPGSLSALYNMYYRMALNREPGAISELRDIFAQTPETLRRDLNPPSLASYVSHRIGQTQGEEANPDLLRKLLTQAISEQGYSVYPYLQLAEMHRKDKRFHLALGVLQQGDNLIEDSAELEAALAATYRERAIASNYCYYERRADLEQAVKHYQQATALAPEVQLYRYYLSYLLLDLNRPHLAIHQAELLLDLERDESNIAYALKLHAFAGRENSARELLKQLTPAGKGEYVRNYRESSLVLGDWDSAARQYQALLTDVVQPSLYEYLYAQIAHEQAGLTFYPDRDNPPKTTRPWEELLWDYWQGEISAYDLQDAASDTCERQELLFFTGYRAYRENRLDEARSIFREALSERAYTYAEYPLSRLFLKGL